MLLKEYEGKKILQEYGIKIPKGDLATRPYQATKIAQEITGEVVLKAQVLAGGRGLAGGIIFAKNDDEVRKAAKRLFDTKIKGLKVKEILVEEKLKIHKEFYVSIMLDRTKKRPVLMGTTEGGVNIEKLGKKSPELISQIPINSLIGVYNYHGYDLFRQFDLPHELRSKIANIISKLYKIFIDKEAFLVEINPLIITDKLTVIAGDCKIIIDPEASYIKKSSSPRYIPLQGDIGILANGAGLTMATMDVVKEYGGKPANFLEVGGEFYKKAGESLEYLLEKRKDLNGLLVNLFGAYARTDIIIRQVVDVLKNKKINIPVSFRIHGTGEEKARDIVKNELKLEPHLSLKDAIRELLESVKERRLV